MTTSGTGISPQDVDVPLDPYSGAADGEVFDDGVKESQYDDTFWIGLAEQNFSTGRDYQDSSLTSQWERNADHFNSRHYRRSAYNTKLYRGRSRLFRPLTRAAERSSSAQFAAAMFSNQEIIDVQAENQDDPEQVAAASMMKQILQYRLEKSIPWYLTCMGEWQDSRVYGPCATYTTWNYEEKEVAREVPVEGAPEFTAREKKPEIISDKPVIEMIPPEGLLLDPACDWRDPIKSSPYVVRLVPMYMVDVLAKMDKVDSKTGEPEWMPLSKDVLMSVKSDRYNTVRQAREGDNRPDKMDSQDRSEFKIVWMHENYVRLDGEELVYWTAGTQHIVTQPVPLREVYLTGERPITYGFSIIEAHRFSPSSPTELIAGLQAGINDVANLRVDNVRLALNKRYIIRRGASVDLDALMRSVPGGGVFAENPDRDVKVIETRDVTGSSYKEQERMETESNDISGTFIGSSVQNNRALNETVGGMEMLAEGSNAISELDIRTFSETWMKPQLELLMSYIRAYESDEVIFNMAFEEVRKNSDVAIPDMTNDEGTALEGDEASAQYRDVLVERIRKDKMTLRVNVGLGATSPQRKANTLVSTVGTISQNPEQAAKIDWDEVSKELFAINGYQDGKRFLKKGKEDQELSETDLEQAYQQGAQEAQDQSKMADVEMRREYNQGKLDLERELGFAKLASNENMTLKQLETKLGIESTKDKTRRDTEALKATNFTNELEFKRTTGKPGV